MVGDVRSLEELYADSDSDFEVEDESLSRRLGCSRIRTRSMSEAGFPVVELVLEMWETSSMSNFFA